LEGIVVKNICGSVAKRVKAPFHGHFTVIVGTRLRDPSSTPTLVAPIVVSLDKALYDDYLCLVATNKQQIKW